MNLIERYIFKKAAGATLITLCALAGVIWIIQALKGIDILTTKGQTLWAYFQLTTLAVPMLIMAVVPIALLLACVHTINGMNSNTELVVINASGASSLAVAKPFLLLALIVSLTAGSVGHMISPWSLVKLKHISTNMRADFISLIVREGTFTEVEKDFTFHVAKRQENGILGGILISDDRDPKTSVIYTAETGVVTRDSKGAFLNLDGGEIHQTDKKDGAVTTINYARYSFDLSSLAGKTKAIRIRPKERPTWELLNPNPNDPYYQESPGRYRSQIHERFSEMLWPFAYVLTILAFSGQARSSRQSYGASIMSSMIVILTSRALAFSAVSSSKSDPDIVWLIYALPLGLILFGAVHVFTNRSVSLPKAAQVRLDAMQVKSDAFWSGLKDRYVAYRRRRAGIVTS